MTRDLGCSISIKGIQAVSEQIVHHIKISSFQPMICSANVPAGCIVRKMHKFIALKFKQDRSAGGTTLVEG